MFNFFNKNKEQEQEEEEIVIDQEVEDDSLAAITYFLDQDGKVMVDVAMPEYDVDSVEKIAKIVEALSTQKCFIQTVEMIRKGLIEVGHEELLVHFLLGLGVPDGNLKNKKDGPCIQPSELLK